MVLCLQMLSYLVAMENIFTGFFGKLRAKKVILLNFCIYGNTLDVKSWALQVSEFASGLLYQMFSNAFELKVLKQKLSSTCLGFR